MWGELSCSDENMSTERVRGAGPLQLVDRGTGLDISDTGNIEIVSPVHMYTGLLIVNYVVFQESSIPMCA